MRVLTLRPLDHQALHRLIRKALRHYPSCSVDTEAQEYLIAAADGDARTLLNSLEVAFTLKKSVTIETAEQAVQHKALKYDRASNEHYDTISAFIKSLRGSAPDAALHYLARMLEAGEDPLFIARRMVIFASEDIGNALPTALVVATSAMQATQMIGVPEARLILAQAVTYLASAPKSRAVTLAIDAATQDIRSESLEPIPLHLRNAVTKFMGDQGYGDGYSWPDTNGDTTTELGFLPESLKERTYYHPPQK